MENTIVPQILVSTLNFIHQKNKAVSPSPNTDN